MPAHSDGWRREVVRGIGLARCTALAELPGVAHAFSTREGAWDAAAAERRRAFCEAAGIASGTPILLHQVHGATIVRASVAAEASPALEADGVIALPSDAPGAAPAVRCADCVPLLLAHRRGRAVAAVHAGWRGTAAGIAHRAVSSLHRLGIEPADVLAALGPAIGPCCYEVGDDVLDAVARATNVAESRVAPRPRHLDLRLANRLQLEAAGLDPSAIHEAPWCTACEPDLFFSYRRDKGRTGSHLACIGWR